MQKSHFQFSSPKLLDFQYSYNKKDEKGDRYNLNTSVECKRNDERKRAEVLVTINTQNNKDLPCSFSITMCACFTWDESIDDPEKFLRYNAPALLIGYMRPIIASVSVFSPSGSFDLPFIDFTNKISDEEMIEEPAPED
jgi:preprotein translocase subunit SecB